MDLGRRKFLIVVGAVLLLAAVVAVIRWRHAPTQVSVVTAAYAPFSILLPEGGVVQYPQIQTMSSEVAGNIGQIFVKTGDHVTAGRLLVTIANPAVSSGRAEQRSRLPGRDGTRAERPGDRHLERRSSRSQRRGVAGTPRPG